MTARFSALVRADIVKLGCRPGLVAGSLLFPVLATAAYFVARHHTMGGHGFGGGPAAFHEATSVWVAGGCMMIVATFVGATAGSQDLQAGVFRELALTGASRARLFAARVPAALAIVFPIVLLAVGTATAFAIAWAAPGMTLSAATILRGVGAVGAAAVLGVITSVGLASLLANRGTVIAVLMTWQLLVSQPLAQANVLGAARHLVPLAALDRLQPSQQLLAPMSIVMALVVLAGWASVALAAGAARTLRMEP